MATILDENTHKTPRFYQNPSRRTQSQNFPYHKDGPRLYDRRGIFL